MAADSNNIGPMCAFRAKYLDDIMACARKSMPARFTQFQPVYDAINAYVLANRLLISDEPTDTLRIYKIYATYAFAHANALANALAEIIPYVRLNTVIRNQEFNISVDSFTMVHMYNIDPNVGAIIAPCLPDGVIATVPPEVQLVDVYHRLYQPNHHKTWPAIRDYEATTWRLFGQTRAKIAACADSVGGSEPARSDGSDGGGPLKVTPDIVADWLSDIKECVIVGNFALTCMGDTGCPVRMSGGIQVIATNVAQVIEAIRRKISAIAPGVPVDVKKYDLNLPGDHRLKKHVVSVRIGGAGGGASADGASGGAAVTYVANVFNSAGYELVPYVTLAGHRIGALTVLLRFLFVDLWFIRMLHHFNVMADAEYKKNMVALFAAMDHMHGLWAYALGANAPPDYIGQYVDEAISKKAAATSGAIIFPYYPAQHKAEHGRYREVAVPAAEG